MSLPMHAPRNPLGPTPPRRAHSIRRTSSIDVTWPQGREAPFRLNGVARDIYTDHAGSTPVTLADARMDLLLSPDRIVLEITSDPPFSALNQLRGLSARKEVRPALARIFTEDNARRSPLYLLLDDIAGTQLVSSWVWLRWPESLEAVRQSDAASRARLTGVCIGFRPGSSALSATFEQQNACPVEPLPRPDDLLGWHDIPPGQPVSMRRARRMDLWITDCLNIDASFQDSATEPGGSRTSVHEYALSAAADLETYTVSALCADPRILPFPECPAAKDNVNRMVGMPLEDFRTSVLKALHRTDGCTHLNDALRALADTPWLAAKLVDFLRIADRATEARPINS